MNALDVQILVSAVGFIASVVMSAVIAGMRWQRLQDKVETLSEDVKEIKGMFTMKLRE